jgi:hypothetical protein
MALTSHPPTPEQRQALRRNAGRSTGPRTRAGKQRASLNALKHGLYARSLAASLAVLGEDRRDLLRLLAELLDAHQPADAAERLLVEDLTALRAQRLRMERALAGVQGSNLERLEAQRRRRSQQLQNESADVGREAVCERGLIRAPDSPAKFAELLELLDAMREQVEKEEFRPDWSLFLEMLYGKDLTLRGVRIASLYEALANPEKLRQEAFAEVPERLHRIGDLLPHLPPEQAERQVGDSRLLRYMARRKLRLALEEETRDVAEKYQLYLNQEVTITPAMREACLAPSVEEWPILRQLNYIDRQIERKTRLLMDMQWERRAREAWEEEQERREAERQEPEPTDLGPAPGPSSRPLPPAGDRVALARRSRSHRRASRQHAFLPKRSYHLAEIKRRAPKNELSKAAFSGRLPAQKPSLRHTSAMAFWQAWRILLAETRACRPQGRLRHGHSGRSRQGNSMCRNGFSPHPIIASGLAPARRVLCAP